MMNNLFTEGPKNLSYPNTDPVAESLALSLTLSIEGNDHVIPGANVKHCELNAFSYGFACNLGFFLPNDQRDDTLLEEFVGDSLIDVTLSIAAVHNLPDPAPQALTVKGIVTKRSLHEQNYPQVSGAPVLYRYYHIQFFDPAQVLWRQHYPCELYVDDSMASVIDAQVVSPITLTIDFEPADQIQPMICLALGNSEHIHPGETGATNEASFYDFLMDYTQRNNGYFTYDYQQHTYSLSADAPELQSTTAFYPHEVAQVTSYWPPIKRASINVLNGTADNSQQTALDNASGVEGIKQDLVLRQAIDDQYTQRKDLKSNQLSQSGQQLEITFSQWPMQDFWPECEFTTNSQADGTSFLHADTSYHCHAFFIKFNAIDDQPEKDVDLAFTQYYLSYRVQAHLADAPFPVLPKYQAPHYPLYVEGLIVSEQGEEDEKTFDVPSNEDTGQFEYKVNIPLWDLTIKVLLEPDFLNTHFYFPFYRNTKLLLGLDLYRAHIIKVLNWGEGVQLPMSTQGNHILFGKTTEDQTSLSHVYEDGYPVLAIKRNKENDTELVRLEEGSIILQTCEED
ncbi:hypothetical protein [Paraglaciecola marina]|uniref:hypothetical protein n=1 Tax=Paraglaciecola marina TaxID=2500157 RepID=UPI00106197C4|nr:hypothetical protein [Paraglaciecola marina]